MSEEIKPDSPPPTPPVPPTFPEHDDQRCQMFREWLDGDFKYIYNWKQWAEWDDDTGWAVDPTGTQGLSVINRARDWGRELVEQTKELQLGKERDHCMTLAKRCLSADHIHSMVGLLKGDEAAATTDFDANPFALGVQNGVVDLRNGLLHPNKKEDMILKKCSVRYNESASCPMWKEFLEQVQPDKEVRDYLQRMIGYAASGSTTEQVLFFLYGMGQNGKSTFIKLIEKLFADYAWRESASLFLEGGANDDKRNILASLPEKRFVIGAEMPNHGVLAEARIKDLTGGDSINARKLFCEAFNFFPTHKLFFYGNYRPGIRGGDKGIWRRINLIPWDVEIPEAKRDRDIDARLWTEAEGILNWIIEGALEWQKAGLRPPQAVLLATSDYREEEDLAGHFLDEHTVQAPSLSIEIGRLAYNYELWTKDQGYRFNMSPRTFGDRIRRIAGVTQGKSNGKRIWKGIAMKDPAAFRNR